MLLMRGVILLVLTALAAAGAMPGSAAADPTITILPPAGAHVDKSDSPPPYFRTANPRPTLGIEADAGSQLRCIFDQKPGISVDWGPCGPPLPGCSAAVCASYRPPSPLRGRDAAAMHHLDVQLVDSGGDELARAFQEFTADFTPPAVSVTDSTDPLNPFRPIFSFEVFDDEYGDPALAEDYTDCSLTRLGAPAAWHRCPTSTNPFTKKPGHEGVIRFRVARRHIDYRFQVRGTDDLGRSTTKGVDFNPVP
jgi:hypothetical protein